jgi:hypothetical protein
MSREKIGKITRYTVRGLPLAGIVISSLLPLTMYGRQLLILALLIWFQVYITFDIFLNGK